MSDFWQTVIVASVWTIVVAGFGGLVTEIGPWYKNLKQPWFKPPDWAFGPAWTVIFVLTAYAGVYAWMRTDISYNKFILILVFTLNSVLNMLWSVLYFKLKRPDWALIEVMFLWLSVLLIIIVVWPYAPFASYLLMPYLCWVVFAGTLNWATVKLNGPFTQHQRSTEK